MLDKVSPKGAQTLTALLPPEFLAKFPLSARFTYASDLEVDPRMEESVREALEGVREANNAKLGELLFERGPIDCSTQFHFSKFSGCSMLASTPRALPFLLAVVAAPFKYRGKHTVRYRMDNDRYSRGTGEYANFDGEVIKAPMPKNIVLCYADSMRPVGLAPVKFPTVTVATAKPPASRRSSAPAILTQS